MAVENVKSNGIMDLFDKIKYVCFKHIRCKDCPLWELSVNRYCFVRLDVNVNPELMYDSEKVDEILEKWIEDHRKEI